MKEEKGGEEDRKLFRSSFFMIFLNIYFSRSFKLTEKLQVVEMNHHHHHKNTQTNGNKRKQKQTTDFAFEELVCAFRV